MFFILLKICELFSNTDFAEQMDQRIPSFFYINRSRTIINHKVGRGKAYLRRIKHTIKSFGGMKYAKAA